MTFRQTIRTVWFFCLFVSMLLGLLFQAGISLFLLNRPIHCQLDSCSSKEHIYSTGLGYRSIRHAKMCPGFDLLTVPRWLSLSWQCDMKTRWSYTPYNTSRPGREELPNSSKERAGAQYEPSPVSMRRRVAYHRPNTPRARPLRSSSGLRVVRLKQYVVPTVWNLNRAFRNSVGRSSERPSTRKQCVWFGTLCLGSRLGVPRQRNLE
jgi:hypothetical protein